MLQIETGFDVIPTWAITELQKNIEEIAGLAAERDRKTLSDQLTKSLAEGMSSKDTASALRNAFDAGITTYDGKIAVRTVPADSWFDMVARTELQRASNLGQYALYEAAGVESVRWQAAEPCDECADADDVVLPLGEDFPGVDVDMPPAHPNCRCVLVPSDDDLGNFGGSAEDRAAARRGNQPASDDDEE
jgi:hypothetical protein